jgi:succinoglycan biosynthesis protein ExoM
MTDDDCEPSPQWLSELVRVREASGADVVTGLMLRRAPPHAPAWIREQPFLELGEFGAADGAELPVAHTNNSLISSAFLAARPELRFDPGFGRIGGEDMAFFHALKRAGGRIVFAADAFVYENEPDERLTLRYQLRRYFWHGNSSVLTSLDRGAGRARMGVHAGGTMARATLRPLARLARGGSPQVLYACAQLAEGLGKLAGTLGVRVNHK